VPLNPLVSLYQSLKKRLRLLGMGQKTVSGFYA